MNYDETMAYGAAQYRDVLDALNQQGLPASFIQTGGMCAAIMVTLESGYYLLITDQEDCLAWERADHQGWFVGLHRDVEAGGTEPIRSSESTDGALETVSDLVDKVLPAPRD